MKQYKNKIPRLNRKRVTQERRIENINPETGVTVEQLIEHLQFLSRIMKEAKFLTDQQKHDAVYIAAEGVFRLMQQGKVPNKDFDLFKSYLFRAAHNAFLQERHRHERTCEQLTGQNEDLDLYIKNDSLHPIVEPYTEDSEEKERLRNAIQLLPIEDKKVLELYFNNEDKTLDELDIKYSIAIVRKRLRRILFPDGNIPKVKRHDWSQIDYPYLVTLVNRKQADSMCTYIIRKEDQDVRIAYCRKKGLTDEEIKRVLRIESL